jgi:esterase/lipase superfamily enzyme
MVGAVAGLVDSGRVKLYCVDSYDADPRGVGDRGADHAPAPR